MAKKNPHPMMTHWNYRIFRYKNKLKGYPDWESFGLHEAYYDDKDKVEGWTEDPIIVGDSVEELLETLDMMKKDIKRFPEILDYEPDKKD